MEESNEERANFLDGLKKDVDKNIGLRREKIEYKDVGPRAKKEIIKVKAPPGHVESLDAQIAKKIKENDYLIGCGEREMLDIIVK